MPVLRTDIERALNELVSQEEGMRFQGLAVVLGKMRWPELIARQRKKDFGLDAYASASQTPEKVGKGLAASITSTLVKVSRDAETGKKNFSDLKMLLFVTQAKVGNAARRDWEKAILKEHGLELILIEREDIITELMMPKNASLCASFLNITVDAGAPDVELISRTRRAAEAVTMTWAQKTKSHPLIDLTAMRLNSDGSESNEIFSQEQIGHSLLQSRRIVLEGPPGCGKTTTLIQLAQRVRFAGIIFIVQLPSWTSTDRGILEYIACMPAFQAEALTPADLARVQQTEPFLFLLNGWNEVTESNSDRAFYALQEIERDLPSAGIIVATRTHHLTPPLPGALRLRLLRLNHEQRSTYLSERLNIKSAELKSRIATNPSLDELTRIPFILTEVVSLFEAGVEIPATKISIIEEIVLLHEQRGEHKNALQAKPINGRSFDYLKAIAIEMAYQGAVSLSEADARTSVSTIVKELTDNGQIDPAGAPAVLAALTSHHILERVDYPHTMFQFVHQQFQEYYAALDMRSQLLDLQDDDHESRICFTNAYVNNPAWAEPLRMIAESFSVHSDNEITTQQNTCSGIRLVKMTLFVDPVFASELAQLCGAAVWNEVRMIVGERLRTIYATDNRIYQQYAIAAMLATGSDDFSDIIIPLLSAQDRQIRLSTYRFWLDFYVTSLGSNWRDQVRSWNDGARADFVSELLYHRINDEIADFAAEDSCNDVKKQAASGLMWTGSDEALMRVLESMDEQTFEEVSRNNVDRIPSALMQKTITTMRKFITGTTDHYSRLSATLELVKLNEPGLDNVIKDTLSALSKDEVHNHASTIQTSLEYFNKIDPAWVSEWVATQIAEGTFHGFEDDWLPFATDIPDVLVDKYLQRLENEDFYRIYFGGIVVVIAAQADEALASRIFSKIRELQHKIDIEPDQRHEFEWHVMRQLETLYDHLPDNIAVAGILSSITSGDLLDFRVTTYLLSKLARPDVNYLRITDKELKAKLRAYLKNSIKLVLCQDDFSGREKANLASSLAQVGEPEDMSDLLTLIHADIKRVRRGRAAKTSGDRSSLGMGSHNDYSGLYINAVIQLDHIGSDQILIDLLPEPEYRSSAADAMARDFRPKKELFSKQTLRYDLIWTAREMPDSLHDNDQRRIRFATALNAEINRLIAQNEKPSGLKSLAKALAAIDAHNSLKTILDVIAMPGKWDENTCVETYERLLIAGIVLPATNIITLVDSILERSEKWVNDSDRIRLCSILELFPFVDDPAIGIAKMSDVLNRQLLRGHELCELVTALGESRSDAAIDLLHDLTSNAQIFDVCINAIANIDSPRSHELLLGFIDPDIQGIAFNGRVHNMDNLSSILTDIALRYPEITKRLIVLCERDDIPDSSRHILSKVMSLLGTSDALRANLQLVNDTKSSPVPQGIWDFLESAFIERQPYGKISNAHTKHARASNDLRLLLFRMVIEDEKRRKSAIRLLGQIETWRQEYGRPIHEPRHPDPTTNISWPPTEIS